MATKTDIDSQNDANKEGTEVTPAESSKQKNVPPPFIIYAETNEQFDEDEPFGVSTAANEQLNAAKKNRRRNRKNRNRNKKGLKEELESLDSLTLPDGVMLVEDGTYIGFQCTYCHCVMSSLKTVEEHVGGNQHQQKIRSKATKGEELPAAESEGDTSSKDVLTSTSSVISNRETSLLAAKSCLNKFLLKTKETIVGLDHVVEVQLPGVPPTFRCNLCILDCDADGIKDHIIGTRHRLNYLRVMDTQKVAEMLALNMKKAERNRRTIKCTEELHSMYGPGTIQITDTALPPITVAIQTETKASAQPHAAVQPGNNPPIIIWDKPVAEQTGNDGNNPVSNTLAMRRRRRRKVLAERKRMRNSVADTKSQEEPLGVNNNQNFAQGVAQKRSSEGGYQPPWKRQSVGRGFPGRRRFNNRRPRGNYFDRRPPTFYNRESNFPDQFREGRPMNREQYGGQSHEGNDQYINTGSNKNENKPYERNEPHVHSDPNREQNGSKLREKKSQPPNKEPIVEKYGKRPFERHEKNIVEDSNRDSWRSYSDDHAPNRPQIEHHTAPPSKPNQDQHMGMENPTNKDLRNNTNKAMGMTRNEPLNIQDAVPPPPPPPPFLGSDANFPLNFQEAPDQNRRGRGRGNRFNTRSRGSSFSRPMTNRFSAPSRFETPSGFSRFGGDFGRPTSFHNFLSDPLSSERDRLKMKYPGLRLGR